MFLLHLWAISCIKCSGIPCAALYVTGVWASFKSCSTWRSNCIHIDIKRARLRTTFNMSYSLMCKVAHMVRKRRPGWIAMHVLVRLRLPNVLRHRAGVRLLLARDRQSGRGRMAWNTSLAYPRWGKLADSIEMGGQLRFQPRWTRLDDWANRECRRQSRKWPAAFAMNGTVPGKI